MFHKILKSGCRAEAARLCTAERLTKLIAVLCIIAWRSFWTTMIACVAPDAPAGVALTPTEIDGLERSTPRNAVGRP
ncbi:hypothetical protein NON00_13775 [Roseomonas sp. GC11]|uniref:hypothetical protein n=1 Tax=Roseomonas sp. GC11 TaxID=2950546 RepID=UPI0021094B1E|nr:hypothetical protein [Roseomonas sp. GC11]MCQ4160992.1 hypothetical protein [Roseomonas sp. GC11]